MKGVNIFLADGFEDVEALATNDVLRRGGVVVWDAGEAVPASLQRVLVPGKGDLRFRLSEERTADFSRAAPAWFRSLMKKEPKPFRIAYRFHQTGTECTRNIGQR